MDRNALILLAATLSIVASIVALSRGQKAASTRGALALRNSFAAQTTDKSVLWNANDQSNPNGMSAYSRNPTLGAPVKVWTGKLGYGMKIPGAGIGGPTGQLQ